MKNHMVHQKDKDAPDVIKSSTGLPNRMDWTTRVSDDPFDILSNSIYKQQIKMPESSLHTRTEIEDSVFESMLIKSKTNINHAEKKHKHAILASAMLLTEESINFQEKKMYKFPFDMETRNDGSLLFKKMYLEYLIALKSVFKMYKRTRLPFYMKIKNDFLMFGDDLRITTGMKHELSKNEIDFNEHNDYLIVKEIDMCLVFDCIINAPVSSSFIIPFILSEGQFDNGILFSIRLHNRCIVKEDSRTLHSYELIGPLWADDYSALLRYSNNSAHAKQL
ncbi:hypothetical protein M896_040220 [Ordospora colligata OC4]|uniref:Uncharacterized protein n=1 Tax=Ordospora colligata OC4 TaxID=1354746 RepID=A0A0B2ULI4_9MICR|nr:uncharacterized protein M896_040220 [Ordospora colligata OC4]KHN69830.1 hypothetical protein M896_040220 [Ordospora colligata OC4]